MALIISIFHLKFKTYDITFFVCIWRYAKMRPSPHSNIRNSLATMSARKVQKVMVQPINLIFRYLQNRTRIQIWLYEDVTHRIEGYIIGFDEYMNVVLDEAEELNMKTQNRNKLGRILLKGDNITMIHAVPV
ncbi:LSM domain protein [Ancylostoma ceylanicum]|uniref:Small nuclear ribonucleoprotein E n=4 Tax=Ancylostoma TaxID=29169 RepID=A0A0D6M126_9BILA|nr:LSM domain protein [Ancylostoma ceylanicum]